MTSATLGEIAESFVDGPFGSKLKASEYVKDGVPVARIQNVRPLRFNPSNLSYITPQKAKELQRHDFRSGDVLITKLGEPCGVACEVPSGFKAGRIVADVTRFRGRNDKIDKRFLVHYLNAPAGAREVQKRARGTTRQRINLSSLKEIPIPLPPLEEQRRIAGILDQADALRRLRTRALHKLNTLGQAIFHDMFGVPTRVPRDAEVAERIRCVLGDQITLQRGKDITKKQAVEGVVPVISSGGTSFFHNEAVVEGPGVLLGRKGSVGKVHYSPESFWPHDTTLYVKDFNDNVPLFVYFFFLQFPISDYEASAANPSLNRNNLHPVEVYWPSASDQRTFAEKLIPIEQYKEKVLKSLDEMGELFLSLQQRAYRGEL